MISDRWEREDSSYKAGRNFLKFTGLRRGQVSVGCVGKRLVVEGRVYVVVHLR